MKMTKKTTEQINREFMENPSIPEERKKLISRIWREIGENEKLSDEELDWKYKV